MIERIWHGYTSLENAPYYEKLLYEEIFPGIAAKNIAGYCGIKLLKRKLEDQVEFITVMRFDSLENIKAFTGEDYEIAYVPDKARKLLMNYDARSQHYIVLSEIDYR